MEAECKQVDEKVPRKSGAYNGVLIPGKWRLDLNLGSCEGRYSLWKGKIHFKPKKYMWCSPRPQVKNE